MRNSLRAFALAATALTAMPAIGQNQELTPPEELVVTRTPGTDGRVITEKTEERVEVRSGWYVGGEFGAMIVEDTNVDIGAVNNALRLNYDYGYDGAIFVGYDLGGFRIEAEAAYKKADLDSFNTSIQLPGEGAVFPASREFAGGSESALSFMINGMLDFGQDEEVGDISGFVGAGIGMARVKANNQRVFANTAPFLDDSDTKLAWQVFAGVRQRVTDNLDVTVKYRFFNVDDVRMVAFNGNESEHRFRSHSLLGGLTFRFGGTRIVVKESQRCDPGGGPVPANGICPGTPGEEIRQKRCHPGGEIVELDYRCQRGPFMVFFDWDRPDRREPQPYVLSEQAMRVLDEAAAQYAQMGSVHVSIEGHTDTSGSDPYNDELSRRRRDAVQAYLAQKGVPAPGATVTGEGYGERCRLVDSGDNVREPQNRRVELYFGNREYVAPPSCPPRPAGY